MKGLDWLAMDENVFLTQKYFVFKLSDILNNSFHIFEEKRLESLLFMIEICIDTYDEMHSAAIGTDKLEKSYRGLLNALAFQLKKHPFRKLPIYRQDFECLKVLIANEQETKLNPYEIHMCLKSLKRKLEK